MSVEHMAMVFRADGLDGGEKLLLLAYTNHTDQHGYCWPSEQRLADTCGTSLSTVARQKRSLKAKGLLKSVRRINPKTGEPISNLTRINLPLLESMRRKDRVYDDDLVQQITFDEQPEGGQRTGSDLLLCHSDGYPMSDRQVPPSKMTGTPPQSDRQTLIDPSGETTTSSRPSMRLVPQQAPPDGGGGGDAPQKDDKDSAAAAFVERLPYGAVLPSKQQQARLEAGVAAALKAGWTETALRVQLTEETKSATSLTAVYLHRIKPDNLPAAPPLPKPRTSADGDAAGAMGLYVRCKGAPCGHRKMLPTPDGLCADCREDVKA